MKAECQIISNEEGKRVFFNRKGNMKRPDFVRIGHKVGPYTKTKTFDEKKYGFMTTHRNVCPPRFTELPEISELFFYGFARMKIGKFWGLVSANGYDILKAQYEGIYIYHDDILDRTVVILEKNGLYGLYIPYENIVTEIKYTDFELKDEYIITFSNELQGILLYNGTELFKPENVKVEYFYGLFLATKSSGKKLLNSPNWSNESVQADEFYSPMHGGIRARICKNYAMLDLNTGRNITQFLYKEMTNFDRAGFAVVKDGLKCKLLDRDGNIRTNFRRVL